MNQGMQVECRSWERQENIALPEILYKELDSLTLLSLAQ